MPNDKVFVYFYKYTIAIGKYTQQNQQTDEGKMERITENV